MQPVPTAPTAAEDGGLSTHVLHMARLHAKRPLLVELRVINSPFEGGCRLQSGGGAWLACNTSPFAPHTQRKVYSKGILFPFGGYSSRAVFAVEL